MKTTNRIGRPRKPRPVSREIAIIRARRLADPRTDAEIMNGSGLHPNALTKIIRGDHANPGYRTIRAILAALGMTWSDLGTIE